MICYIVAPKGEATVDKLYACAAFRTLFDAVLYDPLLYKLLPRGEVWEAVYSEEVAAANECCVFPKNAILSRRVLPPSMTVEQRRVYAVYRAVSVCSHRGFLDWAFDFLSGTPRTSSKSKKLLLTLEELQETSFCEGLCSAIHAIMACLPGHLREAKYHCAQAASRSEVASAQEDQYRGF